MMDVAHYLARIGYAGPLEPTTVTLRELHAAHYRTVPFENLDIGLGRPILLDAAAFYEKIVTHRRGGFCYELNGAFAALLRALGFQVTLLSAGVATGTTGEFGPDFDHLALRVDLDEPWLADVGFGAAFAYPLRLDTPDEQRDPEGTFRLITAGPWRVLEQRGAAGTWQPAYRCTLRPHVLPDFAARCHYHQTSLASHFTQHHTCSLPTATGRITLTDQRLIVTSNGVREEQHLPNAAAVIAALREYFGITLP